MRTMRTIFLMLLLVVAAGAQAMSPDLQPPTVSLYDLRIVDLNPQRQTFAVRLLVKNPNLAEIPLHEVRYRIELNGREIVQGRSEHPVTLPGLGQTVVDMQTVASVHAVIEQLDGMVRNGSLSASYRIHGEARLGTGAIVIPFDQGGSLDLRRLLGLVPPPSVPPPQTI